MAAAKHTHVLTVFVTHVLNAVVCADMLHQTFPLLHLQIKNARTQLAQRLREIRARVRIIISGEHTQLNTTIDQQRRQHSAAQHQCSLETYHTAAHEQHSATPGQCSASTG
jgi:hypothetical protein